MKLFFSINEVQYGLITLQRIWYSARSPWKLQFWLRFWLSMRGLWDLKGKNRVMILEAYKQDLDLILN